MDPGGVVGLFGTFDLLHSGHVACAREARAAAGRDGRVVLAIWRDAAARRRNGRDVVMPVRERKFLCENLRDVDEVVVVDSESGDVADAVHALAAAGVERLLANDEDACAGLREACAASKIALQIGSRLPLPGLVPRSTADVLEMVNESKGEVNENRAPAKVASPRNGAAGNDGAESAKPALAPPRPPTSRPVVFVSGCYDFLHSGHVEFFRSAAELGDLYVSIGSDANILLLKHHRAMFPEDERLTMVAAMRSVAEARVCRGSGMLDFEADLDIIKPDIFFVNEDGHRESKELACAARGIKYVVAERLPAAGLDARSSTALKASLADKAPTPSVGSGNDSGLLDDLDAFPWRICLAGGWLDQPWVSQVVPGPVVVVNIWPHEQFKTRSGLATSTRQVGIKLWGTRRRDSQGPPADVSGLELAYMLFGAENPPGSKYVAGSQDAIGLMLPGINRLDYAGAYWPHKVTQCPDRDGAAAWLQSVLWLVPLASRPDGYDPLEHKALTIENVTLLADASNRAWAAVLARDAPELGAALNDTMAAWRAMLPNTVPMPDSEEWCKPYREGWHGCLFSGCGGGFLMVVSDPGRPVDNGFQIRIKTTAWFDR